MIIGRRRFLQSIGLIGSGAVLGCTGAPEEKMMAYLSPPREMTPGIAAYYAGVCRACPAGCGLLVKTREARPIKLEGSPNHPINKGKLCALGQAWIGSLYSSARLRAPLVRDGEKLNPISWDNAFAILVEKLKNSKHTVLITGAESGSFESVASAFVGEGSRVTYEPLAPGSISAASEALLGTREAPIVDLSSAEYVVSFGVDFLESWISPVSHAAAWGERHGYSDDRKMFVDYFGPRRSLTANAADYFEPTPQFETPNILLALYAELIKENAGKLPTEEIAGAAKLLKTFAPSGVQSNKAAKRILKRMRGRKSVVLFDRRPEVYPWAPAAAAIALGINRLIGAFGSQLVFGGDYIWGKVDSGAQTRSEIEKAAAGETDLLVISGANPAHTLPDPAEVTKRLQASSFTIVFASEMDETAAAADLVLPVHHPLESWGDYRPHDGVYGLMQPVRVPLYKTRQVGDLMIDAARAAGRTEYSGDYKSMVVQGWKSQIPRYGEGLERFEQSLVDGGMFDAPRNAGTPEINPAGAELIAYDFIALLKENIDLTIAAGAAYNDGRGAANDWLLEAPDSILQTSWENPLEISEDIARVGRIADGDRVSIKTPGGQVEATAIISGDLPDNSAAIKMGGGKKRYTIGVDGSLENQTNAPGENAMALVGIGGLGRGTISRIGAGDIARVSGGTDSTGRHLALGLNLKDARASKYPAMTRHGEVSADEFDPEHAAPVPMPADEDPLEGTRPDDNMVELYKHPDYRWGMIVDLDRCNGCGACVAACYAENNIPTVGRDEIIRGRELSWIRIERHDFVVNGRKEMRLLPVMCQHCDQAPCETVCPVFAPYHTADGLNAQVYNRCVGTRFCSNNCPYKVRRFNYFKYPRAEPANQQLNPDVTVRERGVMEKCTFCIQRIREAGNRARFENRRVREGEITPACVQTCPTGALTFGDYHTPESKLVARAADPRGYRLLDYFVNTRPAVVYLRKVITEPEEV